VVLIELPRRAGSGGGAFGISAMSLSRLEAKKEQEESARTEAYLERAQKPKDLKAYRKRLVEEEREKSIYAFQSAMPRRATARMPNLMEITTLLETLAWHAVLEDNVWYYRDRAGVPRGPCTTGTLRTCWINGIIDQYTLVWGMGLGEWLPVRNVTSLEAIIRNAETIVLSAAKYKLLLEPALKRKALERQRAAVSAQQRQREQKEQHAETVNTTLQQEDMQASSSNDSASVGNDKQHQQQERQPSRQTQRNRSAAACLSLAIPLEHAAPPNECEE